MQTLLRFALATLATLLLVELGLRGYRHAIDQVPPHPDPSVADEWDWVRDHLRADASELPGLASYDPQLGWSNGPKIRRRIGDPTGVPLERRPGVPRIVLTGDSFTRELGHMGRTFLPEWEVVNVAVQGYGAGQIWLRYRSEGARWQGDLVVYGLYLRDYFRTFRSFRGYAKPTFSLDAAGEVVVEGVPVVSPDVLLEAYRRGERRVGGGWRSFLLDFLAERADLYRTRMRIDEDEFRLFAAILDRFRRDVEAAGACPFLAIIPTRPDGYTGIFREIDLRTRETARAMGLPGVALAEGLFEGVPLEEREAIFASGSGRHMSKRGRAEAIRLLHEALADAAPGRCPAGRF